MLYVLKNSTQGYNSTIVPELLTIPVLRKLPGLLILPILLKLPALLILPILLNFSASCQHYWNYPYYWYYPTAWLKLCTFLILPILMTLPTLLIFPILLNFSALCQHYWNYPHYWLTNITEIICITNIINFTETILLNLRASDIANITKLTIPN